MAYRDQPKVISGSSLFLGPMEDGVTVLSRATFLRKT